MKFTKPLQYKFNSHILNRLSHKTRIELENKFERDLLSQLRNSLYWPLRNRPLRNRLLTLTHTIKT